MTKQEMIEVKKFIKKHHPNITLDQMTDEFLLEQIKFYRVMKLKQIMDK